MPYEALETPLNPTSPDPAEVRPGGGQRAGTRDDRRLRAARGVLVGGMLAALVLAGRRAGVLEGGVGLALGALLLLAVPTSRLLSRRILLTGVTALGWLPVLWWWALPVGAFGRVALLLALVAALLGGWVAAGERPRDRARRVLPRFGWVDALPVGALAAAVVMLSPWLRARSGESALAMLMQGWDHSAHYDMTEMVRTHGVVVAGAGDPPGGGVWSYAHYPQGFHTVAAALMELVSPVVGTPAQEVALYARSLGLVSALVVVVVVAGIAALPALRRRPLVAAVAGGVVTVGFLWGPGGMVLADGFPNFYFACALLAAVPLLAIPVARWPAPVPILALAGALVGIAHSWVLLLTLALPMALVILLPARVARSRASRGQWVASIAIVLAAVAAMLVAVSVIRVQSLSAIVVLGGGVTDRGVGELVVVTALAFVAVALLAWLVPRPWSADVTRTVACVVGPVVGAAFALWIAGVQRGSGGLGYYFWKYAIALELLALVVGSVAVATLVGRTPAFARSTLRVSLLAAGAAGSLVLGFGAPHPWIADRFALAESSGLVSHARLAVASLNPPAGVTQLLGASGAAVPTGGRSVYLPIEAKVWLSPASTGQWDAALRGAWTDDLNAPIGLLLDEDLTRAGAADLARRVLASDAALTVVVPPAFVAEVRAGVGPGLADRVLTW